MALSSLFLWMALLLTLSVQALPNAAALGPEHNTKPTGGPIRRATHPTSPPTVVPQSSASPISVTSLSPVSYSGPDITGTAHLPASLSAVVFPTQHPTSGFPKATQSLGVNVLPQSRTNGNSPLGTFNSPKYPRFIGEAPGTPSLAGPPPGGFPWGNRTANGTNPYRSAPSTGIVRSYNFVISRGIIAPDGVERSVLLINGAFPGPTIEANWGDTIQVTVTNNITGPEEGTALHWHGLLQKGTPYEDGVPGITQCPIAPGQTFTYSFNADLYGTSWYHSHYSAQYAGGILGAMIIHGPINAAYNNDLGPVILSDYYHKDYYTIVEEVMGTDLSQVAPSSDNNLINGKGVYDCDVLPANVTCTPYAGLSKFQFTSGQSYRLRLINAGAESLQRFSIDNHVLTVIAYDFVPITPYITDVVTLGVGQRADVVVQANGSTTDVVWMRSTISTTCSLPTQPDGLAIIYYQNANTTAVPTSTAWPIDDTSCGNDPLSGTVPYDAITPPSANTTIDIALNFEINQTGHFLWTMDGSSFRTDYNDPILMLADAGNVSYPYDPEWNVYNFGSNKSFIMVINNETPLVHPMHIHGHNMFVLNEGVGSWNGTVVNPSNPTRRDVQLLQPSGYIAIQIDADNPGVWPFHCHVAWHVSGGLYVNVLEHPDLIPSQIDIPSSVSDLCTTWGAYTSEGPIDQIDSGLRKRGHLGRHRFKNPVRRA
ncbi:uncharacterized protein Z518_07732 [Rhinocladiella mackenziei CBS 650.93]|uniref:Laccase n=1 Tax=Rhinocladiella mackenziei CBS 650.93 TaxID=1442369 RepID=A0A0D2H149_9EURO|nr:uncharacterized protein Z518_07732 [Rhinocladiella mackenziei CBS 650.93]KIX04178.1 hypothetical protein Z518_07732 [Rhinocladiella mackenziei CBS 650.93]